MKKTALFAVMVALSVSAMAQRVTITSEPLGSGAPGNVNTDNATQWDNNVFHAPQYMPGFPTAATLYPRIIDVPCTQDAAGLTCKGYTWLPALGRGEYLMIRPTVTVAAKPQVITKTVIKEVTRDVFVEVPAKKKKE